MKRIRVLIADDHAVVRAGIRLLLDAQVDIDVVGEAHRGDDVLPKIKETNPDVVLMDLGMPRMNGLEATRQVVTHQHSVKVVILTMHEDEDYFFQALSAGASGYVLKEASPEELLSAIRVVAGGGVFLYPSVAHLLLDDYVRRAQDGEDFDRLARLTERERDVLRLIALGKTYRQIGEDLHISPRTVEKYRDTLLEKLNLRDRTELIRYAVRKGLLDVG
jgi:two-component system response regulator NreC